VSKGKDDLNGHAGLALPFGKHERGSFIAGTAIGQNCIGKSTNYAKRDIVIGVPGAILGAREHRSGWFKSLSMRMSLTGLLHSVLAGEESRRGSEAKKAHGRISSPGLDVSDIAWAIDPAIS
jgi:hypothetical protein